MNIKRSVMVITGLMLVVWAGYAGAIPQKMTYQGRMTNSSGDALTGDYSVVFTIYDAVSGGNNLWTETRTVSVNKGNYSVILGEDTAISTEVFGGSERWLGIKVESDSEMTPRMKIVSVGNAYKAYDSDNLGGMSSSSFVLKSMGLTDTSADLNRIHMNTTEAQNNNAVIGVGAEFNGSLAALSLPANTLSTQIFGQARNDGTATYYTGIFGKCDAGRNPNEIVAIAGEASGSGTYGLFFGGGVNGNPIYRGLYIQGHMSDWGGFIQNGDASGQGLYVRSDNSTGNIIEANYGGASRFRVTNGNIYVESSDLTLDSGNIILSAGGLTSSGVIDATANGVRIRNYTPASSSEAGSAGLMSYDSDYLYIWVTADNVKRVALTDW